MLGAKAIKRQKTNLFKEIFAIGGGTSSFLLPPRYATELELISSSDGENKVSSRTDDDDDDDDAYDNDNFEDVNDVNEKNAVS